MFPNTLKVFDPRKIEKGIDYKKVNKVFYNRIMATDIWPYVAKMQPGDVFVYYEENTKLLSKALEELCYKYTNMTLKENDLMIKIKKDRLGLLLIKY